MSISMRMWIMVRIKVELGVGVGLRMRLMMRKRKRMVLTSQRFRRDSFYPKYVSVSFLSSNATFS